MYGKYTLIFELVVSNLKSKDLKIKISYKNNASDILSIRGRTNKREKGS